MYVYVYVYVYAIQIQNIFMEDMEMDFGHLNFILKFSSVVLL